MWTVTERPDGVGVSDLSSAEGSSLQSHGVAATGQVWPPSTKKVVLRA